MIETTSGEENKGLLSITAAPEQPCSASVEVKDIKDIVILIEGVFELLESEIVAHFK